VLLYSYFTTAASVNSVTIASVTSATTAAAKHVVLPARLLQVLHANDQRTVCIGMHFRNTAAAADAATDAATAALPVQRDQLHNVRLLAGVLQATVASRSLHFCIMQQLQLSKQGLQTAELQAMLLLHSSATVHVHKTQQRAQASV
jgi:hypothetical protein